MSLLTDEELKDGNKKLEGLVILFWIAAAISGVVFLFANLNFSMIIFGVFVAELIGIRLRKPFAIPLGRAALIVTMVTFFPVGTIFGAILWPRINDPLVKKNLNYEENIVSSKPVTTN